MWVARCGWHGVGGTVATAMDESRQSIVCQWFRQAQVTVVFYCNFMLNWNTNGMKYSRVGFYE